MITTDLRMIVYTAAPGSPDARALELIGAIGLQALSEAPAAAPR